MTRNPDGTYSGTVQTPGGEIIRVTNVVVREKGISWDETIDQTGNKAKPPPAAANTPKK